MPALGDGYHRRQAQSPSTRLPFSFSKSRKPKTHLLREIKSLQENTHWLCNRHGWHQTTVWIHVKSEGE